MKIIKKEWEGFCDNLLKNTNIPSKVVSILRDSFFFGSATMYNTIRGLSNTDSKKAEAVLQSLNSEIVAFMAEAVTEG